MLWCSLKQTETGLACFRQGQRAGSEAPFYSTGHHMQGLNPAKRHLRAATCKDHMCSTMAG